MSMSAAVDRSVCPIDSTSRVATIDEVSCVTESRSRLVLAAVASWTLSRKDWDSVREVSDRLVSNKSSSGDPCVYGLIHLREICADLGIDVY